MTSKIGLDDRRYVGTNFREREPDPKDLGVGSIVRAKHGLRQTVGGSLLVVVGYCYDPSFYHPAEKGYILRSLERHNYYDTTSDLELKPVLV